MLSVKNAASIVGAASFSNNEQKTMSDKVQMYLVMGTRIAGEHKAAGSVVEVAKPVANYLCNTNKAEVYDEAKHKKPKGKAAK